MDRSAVSLAKWGQHTDIVLERAGAGSRLCYNEKMRIDHLSLQQVKVGEIK